MTKDETKASHDVVSAAPAFTYKPYSSSELDDVSMQFYVGAMDALNKAGIPFLVGGAYAFAKYAKIERHTKDFDIFAKKDDADRILACLQHTLRAKSDRTFPHWLYKAILGENFIDIIFSSGNGVAVVDDIWFEKAPETLVLGVPAKLIPAEELIWSKGFIMERERFDGADVAHTIRGWGHNMDWKRLLERYDTHWRVLYSHLILFGYIYPEELHAIPKWVMDDLSHRLAHELIAASPAPLSQKRLSISSQLAATASPHTHHDNPGVCFGTFISRQQYLKDVAEWKYEDARMRPRSATDTAPVMNEEEIAHWTAAAFVHGSGGSP